MSYTDAMTQADVEDWLKAMKLKIESLKRLDIWTLVKLCSDRKIIKNNWAYDIKKDDKRNMIQRKARLVAKGFSQIPGMDITEVFSPVTNFSNVRIMFALAVPNK